MPPVTLDRVQRSVLAPGELLLLAWTSNERSWLLAVSRDTAVSLPLPTESKLERDVNLLREAIAAKPALGAEAIDRMLADAGERLLGPVVPLLRRYGRVIVVPAGSLQRLPFEALRLPLGRGGALAPLGVTHVVARSPSASVLALARSRTRARNGDLALLAVANPRGPGGRALPGALAEVRALEARYRGVRALEAPRDAETALAAMTGAAAVHVAAHADFDPVSPWRSALQLADGPPVRARDLLARKLGPEVVVLAACETAGGTMRGTGGMEGLSTAVICAGARGVVATLWPVDDALARRFVSVFYEEAERAPDAGTALTRARAAVHADGAPARDWAAFTLVGDPAARLRLVRK
jgi:CHAT domain-containing protein